MVPLTQTLSCLGEVAGVDGCLALRLAFTAASILLAHIIDDTAKIVESPSVPGTIDDIHYCHYPSVSKLRRHPPSLDDYLYFKINDSFHVKQANRLIYLARAPGCDKRILIKFTQRYSIELHEFCADRGYAPKILAFERLPGGWFAVAMEFLENALHIPFAKNATLCQVDWTKQLRNLVSAFHDKDLVHGDLRDANIICDGDSVMLIDFDWAGKEGQVSYPVFNLNPDLLQGRASKDLLIRKEDDIRILDNTLAQLTA